MGHRLTADFSGLDAWVHGDADMGTVEVSVQDDGIGIDAELLPLVFELFEQGVTTV